MKYVLLWISISALLLLAINCDSPTSTEDLGGGSVTLSGQVSNADNGDVISGAVVRLLDIIPVVSAFTDAAGQFTLTFEIDSTQEVSLTAFKESYLGDTLTVLAAGGRDVTVPLLQLTPTLQTQSRSGYGASIFLHSQSAGAIGVRESGSLETASLVFEVQDSSGVPVDLEHVAEVQFSLGAAPNGGEFLAPLTVETGADGRVETFLISGTRAGSVQIIAQANINGRTISSQPVAIAIHGGLPDSVHFSVAVEKLNFPGYNIYGLTDRITAYAGDRYGNPVRPNTVVYFTTDGGIIEGSSGTNGTGQASVNLLSAAPRPFHATLGAGFATVTASTGDENNNTISASGIVLFSGVPRLSISPTSFNIPNGGAQNFVYTLSDQNDNPLAEGTSVTVEVQGEAVEALGATNVGLPDTQSRFWTQFSFTVTDLADTADVARAVNIRIRSTGPNGAAQLNLGGIVN